MKLPNTIVCNSPEATLVIAQYLEKHHGITLDSNLIRGNTNPEGDYFFTKGMQNEIRINNNRASWGTQHLPSREGFDSLLDFVKSIHRQPYWKIGCNEVTVAPDGKSLIVDHGVGTINVSKSTLEEMLAALN